MGYLSVYVGVKILEVFDNGLREKGERKRMFIALGVCRWSHLRRVHNQIVLWIASIPSERHSLSIG